MLKIQKTSILIVDDEPDLREEIGELLTSLSPEIKVFFAENGSVAINKCSLQKFRLLITDMKMPKMDGTSFLASVENLSRELIPPDIVVLSGFLPETIPQVKGAVVKAFKKSEDLATLERYFIEVLDPSSKKNSGKPKKKETKLNVEFINPFIEGALSVLETTCFTPATKEAVYIRKENGISGDISAIVSMDSAEFRGSMAISFTKDCFLKLVGQMLDEQYTEINEEIKDAAAEICNQIFGFAKTKLNQVGHSIVTAIPAVVTGDAHTISHQVRGQCVAVKFQTEFGPFVIEAVLAS